MPTPLASSRPVSPAERAFFGPDATKHRWRATVRTCRVEGVVDDGRHRKASVEIVTEGKGTLLAYMAPEAAERLRPGMVVETSDITLTTWIVNEAGNGARLAAE